MVRTPSTMLPLGRPAPAFSLPDTDGRLWCLEDLATGPGLLIMAICNHCPYVKHVNAGLGEMARDFRDLGLAMAAIMPNDAESHPDDGVEHLRRQKAEFGFPFPYLIDADQGVAKACRAACTPDFFLFDGERRLYYRGQMDDSRPDSGIPVTGADLRAAVAALLAGKPAPEIQKPSLGCNIKWKKGNEPDYFPGR